MKSRKAEIEAEEARMKAELSTKKAQRTVERARLEAKLWEASLAVSCEPYYENFPNREPLFDNLPSSSRIPNTVHTAAPQMPVRVCSQLYSSPLVMSEMNNVPSSGQIGKNDLSKSGKMHCGLKMRQLPTNIPTRLCKIEPRKSKIDSCQSHQLKCLTAIPWITGLSLIDSR